jgi:hypothetical protein
MCLSWDAFGGGSDDVGGDPCLFPATGSVINKNTLDAFKTCDKAELMASERDKLAAAITSGEALKRPEMMARFMVLMHADLKKYLFYYWFVFPSLTPAGVTYTLKVSAVSLSGGVLFPPGAG